MDENAQCPNFSENSKEFRAKTIYDEKSYEENFHLTNLQHIFDDPKPQGNQQDKYNSYNTSLGKTVSANALMQNVDNENGNISFNNAFLNRSSSSFENNESLVDRMNRLSTSNDTQQEQTKIYQQYYENMKQLQAYYYQNQAINYLTMMSANKILERQAKQLNFKKLNQLPTINKLTDLHTTIDSKHVWSGVIPSTVHREVIYSQKVFLGGIPDISTDRMKEIFRKFGDIKVEWPYNMNNSEQRKGYAYIIFESEAQVKSLLRNCNVDTNNSYFFKLYDSGTEKLVEVVPWILGDSSLIKTPQRKIESSQTVFVGGLHGKLTAQALGKIMEDLFGGVVYAGFDTDRYKYPIGSGRVTFNNVNSYMQAVVAKFVQIKSEKVYKKIQVDPYLEESLCSACKIQRGQYFCREISCFRYFCSQCWYLHHETSVQLKWHKPLTRKPHTNNKFIVDTFQPDATVDSPKKIEKIETKPANEITNNNNTTNKKKWPKIQFQSAKTGNKKRYEPKKKNLKRKSKDISQFE